MIDGAEPDVSEVSREQLREELPASEMTQREDNRPSGAQFVVHKVRILERDALGDFLQRHRAELHTTEQVRPEPLEMSAREAP